MLFASSWYSCTCFFSLLSGKPVIKIIDIRKYLLQPGFFLFLHALHRIQIIRFDNIQFIFIPKL